MSKGPDIERAPAVELAMRTAEAEKDRLFSGACIWLAVSLFAWSIIYYTPGVVISLMNAASPAAENNPPGAGQANKNASATDQRNSGENKSGTQKEEEAPKTMDDVFGGR